MAIVSAISRYLQSERGFPAAGTILVVVSGVLMVIFEQGRIKSSKYGRRERTA